MRFMLPALPLLAAPFPYWYALLMNPEARARHKVEMAFFKDAQTVYNSLLDGCGDIRDSLSELKKRLGRSKKRLPPAKWNRLYGALMSGEITRGKRSTPGDWAAQEEKVFKASLRD